MGPRRHHLRGPSLLLLMSLVIVAVLSWPALSAGARTLALDRAAGMLAHLWVEPGILASDGKGPLRVLVIGDDNRGGYGEREVIYGQRSDSITIWTIGVDGASVLALPRDLRVSISGHGDQKLSGSADYGASGEIAAARALTGLSINHIVDLRFDGFLGFVDALGGVDVYVPAPIRDSETGLDLAAGRHHLDGRVALQYVRSRQPESLVNGRWQPHDQGDVQRIVRQQRLLGALFARLHQRSLGWLVGHAGTLLSHSGISVDAGFTGRTLSTLLASVATAGTLSSATMCTLPTQWQVPDSVAASPFAPEHAGSIDFRVPGVGTGAMLHWLGSNHSTSALPAGCVPASAVAG